MVAQFFNLLRNPIQQVQENHHQKQQRRLQSSLELSAGLGSLHQEDKILSTYHIHQLAGSHHNRQVTSSVQSGGMVSGILVKVLLVYQDRRTLADEVDTLVALAAAVILSGAHLATPVSVGAVLLGVGSGESQGSEEGEREETDELHGCRGCCCWLVGWWL